jgi:phosphoglycerate kinase
MFTKQTIRDIDVHGKAVLLRADYNVPLKDGKITDDYRIQQSLPTVKYLLERGAKLIICSPRRQTGLFGQLVSSRQTAPETARQAGGVCYRLCG